MKIRKVCKRCGSVAVAVEAWATWDEEWQDYVLEQVFESEYCRRCESSTESINKELK